MKRLLLLLLVMSFAMCAYGTQVQGTVVDGGGKPLPTGSLHFTLKNCDAPSIVTISGYAAKPILSTRIIYAGAGGIIIDQVLGNDVLLCNGVANTTYWHVDVYNGSTVTGTGGGDFIVTGGSWNFNSATPVTIYPVTYARAHLTPSTPSTSGDACNAGDFWVDATYIYVCTATNTIKRAVLSAF